MCMYNLRGVNLTAQMSSISPQVSRILNMETKSSDSSATIVRLRIKAKKSKRCKRVRVPQSYSVISIRDEDDIPFIINILHNADGAKAPHLSWDEDPATDSP